MPFRYENNSDQRLTGTIADLILRRGDIAAHAARENAGIWSGAVQNIGQMVGAIPGQIQQAKRAQLQDQIGTQQLQDMRESSTDRATHRAENEQIRHDEMAAQIGHEILLSGGTPEALASAMGRAVKSGALQPEEAQSFIALSTAHADRIPDAAKALMSRSTAGQALLEKMNAPKPKLPLMNVDPTHDVFDPNTNTVVRHGTPKPEPRKEPTKYQITVPGPNGEPVMRLVTAEELAGGLRTYRAPTAPTAAEPLVAIIGPDGRSVLVPRSQAVGKQPANAREQGRPVTSGDADRIATLDTSLDDIGRLKTALSEAGETGTVAKIGASAPNWVTDMTGWGTDAKKKQALIDRVKQVIGKALEGGVLRKEDELKYEKILPTIGDTTAIVTAKIAGLDAAITTNRQRHLDALADAGYDVTKFSARTRTPNAPANGQTRKVGDDMLTWKTVDGKTGWYK